MTEKQRIFVNEYLIDPIEYKNSARVNIDSYAEMCLRTISHT